MSYCRWSSDDWQCDLYCYEDVRGGFTTHVAGRKSVGDIPRVTANPCDDVDEYLAQHRVQMAWLDTAEYAPLGLPHDGQTFNDADLAGFRARLVALREVGYRFPDYVLEEVDEDILAASTPQSTEAKENGG